MARGSEEFKSMTRIKRLRESQGLTVIGIVVALSLIAAGIVFVLWAMDAVPSGL
jgi:archaellum biogenesis protein FlaJ (TadC family)